MILSFKQTQFAHLRCFPFTFWQRFWNVLKAHVQLSQESFSIQAVNWLFIHISDATVGFCHVTCNNIIIHSHTNIAARMFSRLHVFFFGKGIFGKTNNSERVRERDFQSNCHISVIKKKLQKESKMLNFKEQYWWNSQKRELGWLSDNNQKYR